jgi:hypothetical protein
MDASGSSGKIDKASVREHIIAVGKKSLLHLVSDAIFPVADRLAIVDSPGIVHCPFTLQIPHRAGIDPFAGHRWFGTS